MIKMQKRLWSLLLTVCLVATMMPTMAFAAEKTVSTAGDLTTAIDEATNGDTIKLGANMDISSTGLTIPASKSLTLDLNGNELKVANTETGRITVYGRLTIQDSAATSESIAGKIYTETDYAGADTGYGLVVASGENALIALESGYIYAVRDDASNKGQFALGVERGGDITVTGGKVEAGWYAISGNGNNKTQNSVINIEGGELISTADYAVYLPQSGTTNISGGTIYGAAGGVSMQRGTLNIGGDALITSKGTGDTGEWGDGTGGQGCAALNVNARYGDCTVNISGGELTAESNAVVIATGTAYKANISISGGEFSSNVSKYVAADYTCTESDSGWKVSKKENITVATPTVDSNSNTVTTVVGGEKLNVNQDDNLETDSSKTLTIDASSDDASASSATTSEVVLGGTAISTINESKDVNDVEIKTNVGTLTLDSAAVAAIVDKATSDEITSDVTLSIKKKDTTLTGGTLIYTLTAKDAAGNEVYGKGDAKGSIKVTVSFDGTDKPAVFYLPEGGSPVKVADDKVALDTKNKLLTWTVEHFSDWQIEKSDLEASWVDNGVTKFGSLDTALQRVSDNGTITLHEDITTTDNYKIDIASNKTVTIAGNGHTIAINYTKTDASNNTEKTAPSVEVEQGGTLTLDNVKLKITGNAKGVDNTGKTDIKMGTGITVNKKGTLNLKNGSEITLGTLSRGFIMGGTPAAHDLGKVVVDNSKLTVSNVSGNGSNGGSWDIKNNSEVNFTNCGNFGFSVEELKVSGASQVTVDGAAYAGIVSTDINFSDDAVVTVKNCGASLPRPSTYAPDGESFKKAVELKKNGSLQMNNAALKLENNKNSSQQDVNTIYASAAGTTVTMQGSTFNGMLPTENTTVLNTVVNGTLTTSTTESDKNAMCNNVLYRLEEVLTKAESKDHPVYLVADAALTTDLSTGVTLIVPSSKTLTVETAHLANLAAGGTLQVQAGGRLKLADELFVGDASARLNLTSGCVEVQELRMALLGDSAATIPSGKEFFLQLGSGNAAQSMTAEIKADATLTVEGKLTVVNDSKLTVAGTLNVESDGIVRVNSKADVDGSGAITNRGVIALMKGAGDSDKATVSPDITLASASGVVYSQFDVGSDVTIKNVKAETLSTPVTVDGVANSSAEETATPPTFGYRYSYYIPSSSTGGGSSTPTYSITTSSTTNGVISVSPKNASKDEKVTITVNPKDGYVLDTLTVKDVDGKVVELKKEGSTVYTFKMPASKVTISATFTEETAENENPFVDVFSSDYYYDAVLWAVENGITTGLTATKFGPDQEVSRAQMVTFLWRAAGSPKATASNPFTDVKSSDYYYDAVQWAVANGVTNGTSATTFSPEAPVSRAQAVTFQWRAAGSPKVTASSFSDVSSDAYYADAVAWAVANEITNGVTATKFGPDVTVSRAQAVTFLYREAN